MSNPADRSITSATSRGTLRRNRVWTFVALCAAAAIVAAAYTARAVRRGPAAPTSEIELRLLATVPSPPYLIVSSTAPGNMWRRLMLAPVTAPDGAAYATSLECERAYFAGQRG